MNTLLRLGSATAILALFFTASTASAQIRANTNLNINASVSATSGTTTLQRSATSTGAGNAQPNANIKAQMNSNVNSRLNATGTATGTDDENVDEDGSFTITRSDIKGDIVGSINPADVTTSSEFSAYARSVISVDENVTKIESDDDSVSIWYKEPAKFLGIVPIMVNTKATVEADGTVTVDYPWWYGIFVTDGASDKLESSLTATAGTIARAEGEATLSSAAQARLLNALRTSMKMHFESNVSTSTTTDASTY